MNSINPGLFAIIILAFVHLFSNQTKVLGWIWHGRFLSFAAGLSFAYIFVDLLPTLEKGQPILKQTFDWIIPYFDKHAYLLAFLGVLFYYGIHTHFKRGSKRGFWLGMLGQLLFNFLLGASLYDSKSPEIQPLALFTIAIAMHYFVRDHNLEMDNKILYKHKARFLLTLFLFLGYLVGYVTRIPDAFAAALISFLSGGVMLNAFRYELPEKKENGYVFFLLGSVLYAAILLAIGDA